MAFSEDVKKGIKSNAPWFLLFTHTPFATESVGFCGFNKSNHSFISGQEYSFFRTKFPEQGHLSSRFLTYYLESKKSRKYENEFNVSI